MPSEIVITGVAELEKKIGRMRSVRVLVPPMNRAVRKIHKTASTYPPRNKRRAGIAGMSLSAFKKSQESWKSREYVRTNLLMGGWQSSVDSTGDTLIGAVTNNVPYGPYVMGPGPEKPMQAWMHVGIWRTTDEVVDKHKDEIVQDFNRTIQEALAK